MPITVKVSIVQDDVQWSGTDLIVPFICEPLGRPQLRSSVPFAAASFSSAQAAAQFKNLVATWITQQAEYAGLTPGSNDISVIGGFQ